MKKNQNKKNNKTFEEHLKNAKETITKLESGNCTLDEMLSLYEDGINSLKFCTDKLNEFEKKIEIIKMDKNNLTFEEYK